jgi:hypothetical protein
LRDNAFLKALALATQLGFTVACPLVLFIGGGAWADQRLGTAPWLFFLGLVLGLVMAGFALFQLASVPTRKRTDRSAKSAPEKIEPRAGEDVGTNHASNERDLS